MLSATWSLSLTLPYTLQQNEISKRKNITLVEIVNAMLLRFQSSS
jgi:hypothetical protein